MDRRKGSEGGTKNARNSRTPLKYQAWQGSSGAGGISWGRKAPFWVGKSNPHRPADAKAGTT